MDTLLVELTHKNALQLLKDLEALDVIRLHEPEQSLHSSISKKYRGILSKDESRDLSRHVEESRKEWRNI